MHTAHMLPEVKLLARKSNVLNVCKHQFYDHDGSSWAYCLVCPDSSLGDKIQLCIISVFTYFTVEGLNLSLSVIWDSSLRQELGQLSSTGGGTVA